ncbi:MAG: Uma2 family endonuclease [Planctomycetota bacterium]|nr:Uma2 family endonuclease [Planctomycetota bacterium]
MSTIVLEEQIRIPDRIVDLDSFRRWARSDDFPERGRFSHLQGEVWVDLMPEQLFTHNQVKVEYASVIFGLLKADRRGRFFGDRTLVSHLDAGLSTEPDGTFVSYESLQRGRVQLIEGGEGFLELEGAPDMVLEVVSTSSVRKDTVVLRELYWQAGIPEYWLVDARGNRLQFDILKFGRQGYVTTRTQSGWLKSAVFRKSFRLTSRLDELGHPEYTLSVR